MSKLWWQLPYRNAYYSGTKYTTSSSNKRIDNMFVSVSWLGILQLWKPEIFMAPMYGRSITCRVALMATQWRWLANFMQIPVLVYANIKEASYVIWFKNLCGSMVFLFNVLLWKRLVPVWLGNLREEARRIFFWSTEVGNCPYREEQ